MFGGASPTVFPAGYRACGSLAAAVLIAVLAGRTDAQVFLSDDPIWTDPDRLDVPAPDPREVGEYYDFWINTFGSPGSYAGPALNANTLGDVPASSWYTPRHYWHPLSIEELRRGPNRFDGPANGTWQVVAGKLGGKTEGIEIVDARGDRYLLKFDVPGHIELLSGAEVISTRILYALGYHVPENYAVRFDRDRLVPGDDATLETSDGEIAITQTHIDEVLLDAAAYPDGTYRALASRYVEGDPIGPFLYYDTRPDDGNDVIPHEARRELRGLRVISAWINHTDARATNTLDTVVKENGRQFVRHHLIDFGSTLGAGASGPKRRWDGFEYVLDGAAILRRTLTLGAAGLEWAAIDYADFDALGHVDAEHFDPVTWRPQYPNAAFRRCDEADAFWAAKQIKNLTDDAIRAIVESADYSDPETARQMVDVLARRRDKIGRAYLSFGGGLDRFETRNGYLVFDDLPARFGQAPADRVRRIIWRAFDNMTGEAGDILTANRLSGTRISVPPIDHEYLVVELRTPGSGSTRVYLRAANGKREVVGVGRTSR